MATIITYDKSKEELEQWHLLCRLLKESGAVTQEDLDSAVVDNNTQGQRLLNAIRHWGKLLVELYTEGK